MNGQALVGAAIVQPDGIADDATRWRLARAYPWHRMRDAVPAGYDTVALEGGWLLPGFIDTQVNGGGGNILANDQPDVEAIRAIASAHRRFRDDGSVADVDQR